MGIVRMQGYGQTQIAPYPIIFVHGLNSGYDTWEGIANFLTTGDGGSIHDMKVMDFCLNHDGHDNSSLLEEDVYLTGWSLQNNGEDYSKYGIYAINFNTDIAQPIFPDSHKRSNQSAIYKQGCALGKMISYVLSITHAKKVILVGHSMGGLAIREYLQRVEPGSLGILQHKWWYDPWDKVNGHRVAKVVTIGTPHGGSDWYASGGIIFGDNLKSEAMRDMDPNEIYLNGGSENSVNTFYYNSDINCDNETNDIIGINSGKSINPNMPLPTNIAYTWVNSKAKILGGLWSDGAVSFNDQFPHTGVNSVRPNDGSADTLTTNKRHDFETADYYSLIRGLDEPDDPKLAYEIEANTPTKGFITIVPRNEMRDYDRFKIVLTSDAIITVNLTGGSNTAVDLVQLYDEKSADENPLVENFYPEKPLEFLATKGTYFIRISGRATTGKLASYQYPYTLNVTLSPPPPPAAMSLFPGSLQYYDVLIGSPKYKTVTLSNKGDASILITSLALTGANANQFTREPLPPLAIAPGASLDISVGFNPTSIGAKVAALEITTNRADIPVKTVSLNGVGTDHETKFLSINNPITYSFPDTKINLSKTKTFTLQNTGSTILTVSDLSIGGLNPDPYTITSAPTIPLDIGTGEIKYVTVKYSPTAVGSTIADLLITNNSDNRKPIHYIELKGNGLENYYTGNTYNSLLAYEYWFDDQYGTKVKNSIVQDDVSLLDAQISTDGLETGLHSIHIRYQDMNGKWSGIVSDFFHKLPITPVGSPKIVASEYWFDTNYASKVSATITPGQTISANGGFDVGSLKNGLHSYHVRYKDDAGQWSSVVSEFFQKLPVAQAGSRNITASEYWFDDDFANKFSSAISPGQIISTSGGFDVSKLESGLHSYHVRYKDDAGQWSSVVSEFFQKLPVTADGSRKITASEYWFDTNYASKFSATITPGQTISANGGFDVGSLKNGLHSYHVRYKDDAGQWSSVVSEFFQKVPVNPLQNNLIITYRYWFDSNDQSMVTIDIPTSVNPYLLIRNINASGLAKGDHTIHFQFKDSNQIWSSVITETITITNTAINVVPVANAGVDQSVNEGTLVTLDGSGSTDADGNTLTYKWTAPSGITLSSATDAKPTFTAPEVSSNTPYTFSLVVNDGSIDSPADQVVVTVKQVNKAPVANAGADQSVNEGTLVTLDGSGSTDADGNSLTYKWTAPSGIMLSLATVAKPTFTAPEVSADKNYTFSLVVNDGQLNSIADEVVITVKNVDKAPYIKESIKNVSVDKRAPAQTIDLKTVFADDDILDVLAYRVVSNTNDKVVTATITGTNLILSFSAENVGLSEITISAGCNGKEVQSKFNVEVKIPTGIDPIADSQDILVYPNPTKGKVLIRFNQTPKADTWITVYSLTGNVISKSLAEKKEESLNLKGNSPGLYFININSKGSKTYKIVLN